MINNSESYKRLFENSPAPMYIYNIETFQFVAVNNASLKQYGYTRDEFLSMKATDIRPVNDVASFKAANVGVPGNYFDFGHWRHIRKNLETFYVQIYGHKTTFEGRHAVVVMAVDVDEKVKVERELSEKISEISGILESITDGFYALDSAWNVTYINKAAERVLCCKRKEVLGKNIWDFFPRAREGRFYNEYHRAMAERVSVQFEECYVPLGVWGSIRVYPTKGGIAVYFVDITEQKKIQEKIYNDEQNLRAIINNTRDAIWSIDRKYRFISANTAFWERLRLKFGSEERAFKRGDFDKEKFKEWGPYYERAFAGEAFSIVRVEENGVEKSFEEVSFNPIYDQQQEVIGISCFARDITEQYLYLQKIKKQNERLRKIAWLQSHDLRAPLANIMGLSALFDINNCGDDFNKKIVELLIDSARQMDEIVKKITLYTIDKEEFL